MKIEVGKKYKTRNGKTVFINCLSKKGFFIGEMIEKDELVCMWFSDGKICGSATILNHWDLVSEVKEKLSITFEMDIPKVFEKIDARVIENACKKLTGGFKCNVLGTLLDTNWLLSELHHSEIKISLQDSNS